MGELAMKCWRNICVLMTTQTDVGCARIASAWIDGDYILAAGGQHGTVVGNVTFVVNNTAGGNHATTWRAQCE